MTLYPAGQEPDYWDPDPSVPGYRFALGRVSGSSPDAPPLIAVCMNPSHAREDRSDKTVNRLIEASEDHKYSGWIMLNLYPERSPKPSELGQFDATLSAENKEAIAKVLSLFNAMEVLGAWGDLQTETLRAAKRDLLPHLALLGVQVFTLDSLTTKGNPRHPSPRGSYLPMLGPKVYVS